jgi:hypothetical protein
MGNEEIEVVSVTPLGENGQQIRYRQTIGGIPIDIDQTYLIELGPEGEVKGITSRLVDPSNAPDLSDLLSHEEARSIALAAIEKEFPGATPVTWFSASREVTLSLSFQVSPGDTDDSDPVMAPVWRTSVMLTTPGGPSQLAYRSIEINAIDGSVSSRDGSLF